MSQNDAKIILYTSRFCGHSWSVERFMRQNEIDVELINIDDDPVARQELIALNDGYASVPTLIFPDGEQMTEPSLGRLRQKLALETPGLLDRVRSFLGSEPPEKKSSNQ